MPFDPRIDDLADEIIIAADKRAHVRVMLKAHNLILEDYQEGLDHVRCFQRQGFLDPAAQLRADLSQILLLNPQAAKQTAAPALPAPTTPALTAPPASTPPALMGPEAPAKRGRGRPPKARTEETPKEEGNGSPAGWDHV